MARCRGGVIGATVDSPDMIAKLDQQGVNVEKMSSADLGKRMAAEQAK